MTGKDFELEKECELRIYVKKNTKCKITLLTGRAEIFGSEMVLKETYSFLFPTEQIIPIFTWHGCTVKVHGSIDSQYVAQETPMAMYLNVHACLEKLRMSAHENGGAGPITMIVGPSDVGKTSLCKILINYAVREGRQPLFVDIDVSQGSISIPSTIGAAVVENEIPIDSGLGMDLSQEVPLVFCYGKCSPSLSSHYNVQVSKLSDIIREKLASKVKVSASGVIINTGGSVRDEGYKMLLNSVAAFEVDVILVVEDEKLYNYLNRDLPVSFVKIHFVPKSDGIKKSEKDKKMLIGRDKIMEYFFGWDQEIESYSFHVPFSNLQIYEIKTTSIDESSNTNGIVVSVDISKGLKKRILAISIATEAEKIISSPVVGFICLTRINMEEQKVTVLSPQSKPLPKSVFILTSEVLPSQKKNKSK